MLKTSSGSFFRNSTSKQCSAGSLLIGSFPSWRLLGKQPITLKAEEMSFKKRSSINFQTSVLFKVTLIQERKISPKRKFLGRISRGHPGSFARISRPKTSARTLKILGKQAFLRGHPWPEGADVHDPKGSPKNFGQKTLGWIFVQGELKGTELRWQREPKTQIFVENRRFSQIRPFSWKFKHLDCTGNRRFSQKTEDFRRKPQETADWAPSP